MSNIEQKLQDLYSYIQNYTQENGFPPTVRDICKDLSIKSTASVNYYINKLTERGLISKMDDKKRAITLPKSNAKSFSVPLLGTVTAGTPIFAVENYDTYYALPDEFNSGEQTFMLTVKGESMINAGIFSGDKIIVKRQESAENGEIVVALIEDSATVKRFYRKNGQVILHPENDYMNDMIFDNVQILGVVTGLIRKF